MTCHVAVELGAADESVAVKVNEVDRLELVAGPAWLIAGPLCDSRLQLKLSGGVGLPPTVRVAPAEKLADPACVTLNDAGETVDDSGVAVPLCAVLPVPALVASCEDPVPRFMLGTVFCTVELASRPISQ